MHYLKDENMTTDKAKMYLKVGTMWLFAVYFLYNTTFVSQYKTHEIFLCPLLSDPF